MTYPTHLNSTFFGFFWFRALKNKGFLVGEQLRRLGICGECDRRKSRADKLPQWTHTTYFARVVAAKQRETVTPAQAGVQCCEQAFHYWIPRLRVCRFDPTTGSRPAPGRRFWFRIPFIDSLFRRNDECFQTRFQRKCVLPPEPSCRVKPKNASGGRAGCRCWWRCSWPGSRQSPALPCARPTLPSVCALLGRCTGGRHSHMNRKYVRALLG
jgi:hypothetical protein